MKKAHAFIMFIGFLVVGNTLADTNQSLAMFVFANMALQLWIEASRESK